MLNISGVLNDISLKPSKVDTAIENSLRTASPTLEASAKLKAPFDTGKLQSSIEVRVIDDELSIFIDSASPAGSYANFVHDKNPFIEEAIDENEEFLDELILREFEKALL